MDFAVQKVFSKYDLGVEELKEEQEIAIEHILDRRNVVVALPTGFGKSLIYVLPPLLCDELHPGVKHIGLVVSPLRSLMHDQATRIRAMGISVTVLKRREEMNCEEYEAVRSGSASIILTSPEALESGPWMKLIKAHRNRVSCIAVDEVHCLSEWGSDFRPSYLQVAALRSRFSAPFVCLSATLTQTVLDDIVDVLKLNNFNLVAELPDRPNIFLEICHQKSYCFERDLGWVVEGLKSQEVRYPKTIIFAETINQVAHIYQYFTSSHSCLGRDKRLVLMYHGEIGKSLQEYVLSEFVKPESLVRVLICTIAFGMGVEIRDIQTVIHWGKSRTLLDYWQEVGRAGRDGRKANAIWYPQSVGGGKDKEVFHTLKINQGVCIRETILKHFYISGMKNDCVKRKRECHNACLSCDCDFCSCCSHCKKLCRCN